MAKKNVDRKRIKKNASERRPAMMMYVHDYLNNANLNRSGLDAQGLWSRFLFKMHLNKKVNEYGVFIFAKVAPDNDKSVKILLHDLLKQKYEQNFDFAANLLRDLVLKNDSFCSTFEDIIGTSREKFSLPLAKLLLAEVAKINDDGFLYSSRMQRDAQLSETRARAGREGGKATQKKIKASLPDIPKTAGDGGKNFASNFDKSKGAANVEIANAISTTTPYNNSNGGKEGGTGGNFADVFNEIAPASVRRWYSETAADLNLINIKVNDEQLGQWREFVQLIVANDIYHSAFVPKFITPERFAYLIGRGFDRSKWEKVLKKLSGLGFRPEQDLYLRITDALNWKSTFAENGMMPAGDSAGQQSAIVQRTISNYHDVLDRSFALKQIDEPKYRYVKDRLEGGKTLEQLIREYEQQSK